MGGLALATAWIGGFIFAVFWWLAVRGRPLGVAAAYSAARGSPSGWRSAAFSLRWLRCSRCTIPLLGVVAGLVLGAARRRLASRPARRRRGRGWASLYAGALVASVTLLRISPSYGLAAILWIFAVVWGADIAAYFAGRTIGGPKLWPSVSPGKTWSGAIVGALAGAASRPHAYGLDESLYAAVLARTCDGDRVGTWRFVRNPPSSDVSASKIRVASSRAMEG